MLYCLFFGGVATILLTFPIVCYGFKNWKIEKAELFARIHRDFIHFFMVSIWISLAYNLMPKTNLLGIIVLLILGWLVMPIKHPADYKTFGEWWKDKKNWHRGVL